jgi:hypothetical protein
MDGAPTPHEDVLLSTIRGAAALDATGQQAASTDTLYLQYAPILRRSADGSMTCRHPRSTRSFTTSLPRTSRIPPSCAIFALSDWRSAMPRGSTGGSGGEVPLCTSEQEMTAEERLMVWRNA